ncbi:hypothetical protein [Actinosynnema sp. NPDC020468]|uniref:hypothetical protein n=1 Tax=Actinosynnema sp. NPDC020468 TaxID=3154488 RepID=UPI0033C3350E
MRKIITSVVSVLALLVGSGMASATPATTFSPVGPASAKAGAVAAFHGFSSFKGITIESSGFDLDGELDGTLTGYSYEAIYDVYNLKHSESWKAWVVSFKKDSSQDVLQKTFGETAQIKLHFRLGFHVKAKDLRGVARLRIGFETLRLTFNGTSKDFTVINGSSGGGKDQNDKDIPVEFEPVLLSVSQA